MPSYCLLVAREAFLRDIEVGGRCGFALLGVVSPLQRLAIVQTLVSGLDFVHFDLTVVSYVGGFECWV